MSAPSLAPSAVVAAAATPTGLETPALKQCLHYLTTTTTLDISIPPSLFYEAMTEIMTARANTSQIGGFLSALSPARISPSILAACARSMRDHCTPFVSVPSSPVMDIVGTGGDGANTFNVSTAASIIVAAAGQPIIKHGNRSSSGQCGSADLIEATGAVLSLSATEAADAFADCGYVFLFAQSFHPAMKHVGPARRALGVRTIFNMLGPLTNPAVPAYQMTGVYSPDIGELFAKSLHQLGVQRALIVHGGDGLDEISPTGTTQCWQLNADGVVTSLSLSPADFGLPSHPIERVRGGSAADNVKTLLNILKGEDSPVADWVIMNSAAALVISERTSSWKDGVEMVRDVIRNGKALRLLERYITVTQSLVAANKPKLSILDTIAIHRRTVIDQLKQETSMQSLLLSSLTTPPPTLLSVVDRVRQSHPVAVMAEIKRASPSLGDIAADIDPVQQALLYAVGGASVISVLTEPKWFKGTIDDLAAVRRALEGIRNRPCILLKDFVIDEWQLVQARIAGADTALLIVAILPVERLKELMAFSRQLGMEPLVEVANEREMSIALSVGANMIGVNNRDLHTFNVNTNTTNTLAKLLDDHYKLHPNSNRILLVALSGIKTRADVETYVSNGAEAVLVGETLMKSSDPSGMIQTLMGKPTETSENTNGRVRSAAVHRQPFVKICGIRDTASAVAAASAGADMIGLIFAKSKRQVDRATAEQIVQNLDKLHTNAHSQQHITNGQGRSAQTHVNSNSEQQSWLQQQSLNMEALIHEQRRTHGRPLVVGVFMDQSIDEINEIASAVGLDLIQLHGSEGFDIAMKLCRPVIRVIPIIPALTTADDVISVCRSAAHVSAVLLDTKTSAGSGGTGITFDWSIGRAVSQHFPIIIAGGLTPNNVAECVRSVQPWMVDVASGVEMDDGTINKDHTKIRQFIQNSRIA